jgi:hypothetical protein
MTMNIALGAYILGTITLLVVKGDEATGKFRDKMHALSSYAAVGAAAAAAAAATDQCCCGWH